MGPRSAAGQQSRPFELGHQRLVAAVVGLEIWLVALLVLPAPVIERIFLAAPLVIVPALLPGLAQGQVPRGLDITQLAPWPALLAAMPLMAALSLPAGPVAFALAAPWILLCGLAGLTALVYGLPRLAQLLRPSMSGELATAGALGLLAVGGLFLLANRLGIDILGFGPTSLLLGAVHYHFLGFALLALAASNAADRPVLGYAAALGILVGVPLSAAGMIIGSSLLNWLGVLVVATGVVAVIGFLLSRAAGDEPAAVRILTGAAAVALAAGISLGVAWSSSLSFGFPLFDQATMVRTHGALNATGVLLAALAALKGSRRA